MSTHQCPVCELRFAFTTELESHLAEEHADRVRGGVPEHRARSRSPRASGARHAPVAPARARLTPDLRRARKERVRF